MLYPSSLKPASPAPTSIGIAAACLLAHAVACGGKAVIDGEGVAGGSSGVQTVKVACGPGLTCTDEHCCLALDTGSGTTFCASSCPPASGDMACDGPEDCADDAGCCGDVDGYACAWACQNKFVLCHTDADCDGPATCQWSANINGVEIHYCL